MDYEENYIFALDMYSYSFSHCFHFSNTSLREHIPFHSLFNETHHSVSCRLNPFPQKKKTPYLFRLFCMCTCKIMMWMVCMYMNPIMMIPQCAIHAADSSTTMFSIPHFPLSPFVKLRGTFHQRANNTKNTFQYYQIFGNKANLL